ncbi:MAG: hypothetical protein NBKEAIPA_01396 [Nitrospirae bacterium]|nr:MAG: type I antifreeze protein [Nitrospira sp. OLB3]MBV6469505.1 hypothetical protein [Nitrospirota bacterium]MCE7965151.1 FmdB family transcriptional regulator [Nitrospira sp. NTP2]QOJ33481.1 MAG: FmdB family transcriptional regulator [Nitrospira sp.]RIK56766.1 MAG: FmdB family transcriptional regulator [Nitrospira sp.]
MPIYEYQCTECGYRFEVKQGIKDDPIKECARCGKAVNKLISPPAIMFKGSGWYITDYSDKLKPGSGTDSAEKPASSETDKQKAASTETAASPAASPNTATNAPASTGSTSTGSTGPSSTGTSSSSSSAASTT